VSILEQLAAEAIRRGADSLEVEYKDGCERVFAVVAQIGYGIASLDSTTKEAEELRTDLYAIRKKGRWVTVDGSQYELRARVYDSFGEDAFRVQLRRA
jgi:hypothetical protein